ncbi:sigma-70 family RNA polymerase sigma factor [Stieleria sp. TO1_6]|uniref:sigma-70 family RNA polymerase sigma factor n=1 Tax=Stieleria tagensis TaxID=2956795 RepID=UPI00209B7CBB|nr:sigma-70 family RNA polymerase sigma factor [Stieleria tagensis]MCO8123928.1 sigma-70 family RNA polymerase sigma factor [Stieleria tagensis]
MDETVRQAARHWTLAQPAVSAFIASVVRDFRDRDDVLQNVAVAVIESFDSYDRNSPFIPWAIGIARRQVGLYLRRRGRDPLVFDDDAVACLAVAFNEQAQVRSTAFDFLQDCLGSLDGRAKNLIGLRYREDLKPAAIASQTDMNPNSVAKALQRIRDQLRQCIERKALEANVS